MALPSSEHDNAVVVSVERLLASVRLLKIPLCLCVYVGSETI